MPLYVVNADMIFKILSTPIMNKVSFQKVVFIIILKKKEKTVIRLCRSTRTDTTAAWAV